MYTLVMENNLDIYIVIENTGTRLTSTPHHQCQHGTKRVHNHTIDDQTNFATADTHTRTHVDLDAIYMACHNLDQTTLDNTRYLFT